MSRYVRNEDLTLEYIIMRAFQVGAIQVYSDIRPGYHRQIVTVWKNGEVTSFPMQPYRYSPYNPPIDFSNNLVSFRRTIENQGFYLRIETREMESTYGKEVTSNG